MKSSLPAPHLAREETAPDSQFDLLLRMYGGLLRRTIRRICPREPGVSCEDVEQEARISLWKALQGETEIEAPVSYIRKVAMSVTLRAVRRARGRKEETLDDVPDSGSVRPLCSAAPPSPEDVAQWGELQQKVDAAMCTLSENRRIAVGLYLQDLSSHDIAELLGWSAPKARNLVHRGLKDLRVALSARGVRYRP